MLALSRYRKEAVTIICPCGMCGRVVVGSFPQPGRVALAFDFPRSVEIQRDENLPKVERTEAKR